MKAIEDLTDDEVMSMSEEDLQQTIEFNTHKNNINNETQEESSDNEPTEEVGTSEDISDTPENEEINSDTSENNTNNSNTITSDASPQPQEEAPEAINYEEFYKEVMAPLKANGTTIQLKSPKEAIQLMQMGANYTKKMQSISQYKKTLLMLQNNQIDEDKLSFLIDLDKRNPEAIKKLLIDSNINPYDIDTSEAPDYKQGNHKISDEEATFTTVLEDLQQVQGGTETIQELNSWDQASKNILWTNPEIMKVIHEQRESGVYKQISEEIERQKMLGQIAPNIPFLVAYKTVGDAMVQAKQNQARVVGTKVAKPKSTVINGDKAKAASLTKVNSNKVNKPFKNFLAMSDEEFLKHESEYLKGILNA